MYEENFRLQTWNKQWDEKKVSLGDDDIQKIVDDVKQESPTKWYV